MSKPKPPLGPTIQRVRVEKLTIFEITEMELEALEQGHLEALYLNLGIGTASIAVSFLISLLTSTIDDTKTFCVFAIVCGIGFVAGVTFGLLWWRSRKQLKKVSREIRARMPPEGIPEDADDETPKAV